MILYGLSYNYPNYVLTLSYDNPKINLIVIYIVNRAPGFYIYHKFAATTTTTTFDFCLTGYRIIFSGLLLDSTANIKFTSFEIYENQYNQLKASKHY